MSHFYRPLDSSKPEIRLLKFTIDQYDCISGTLHIATLSEELEFTALSYLWGDCTVKDDIVLDGWSIAITANLAEALRHVTSHWKKIFPDRADDSFLLWVDAVCVNQADIAERNQQVMLMAEVYSHAELVLSWLGDDSDSTYFAFHVFEIIADNAISNSCEEFLTLEWMRAYPNLYIPSQREFPYSELWLSTITLFHLEYWKRVWIFQEIALARNLVICAKTRALEYSKMSLAWQGLTTFRNGVANGQITCPQFLRGRWIWNLLNSNFLAWETLTVIEEARLKAHALAGQGPNPHDGWLTSLMGGRFRATDPKDHIYGLMSLSRIDIVPDYSTAMTVSDVYIDYVSSMLKAFTSELRQLEPHPLSFLFYCGVGLYENTIGLPSWVPNFPEESLKGIITQGMQIEPFSAYQGVFPPGTPSACVLASNLRTTGLVVEPITMVDKAPSDGSWYDGSMLRLFESIVAREKERATPSDLSPLQRILRTLLLYSGDNFDESFVSFGFHLLKFLITRDSAEMEKTDDHLKALGPEPLGLDGDGRVFDEGFNRGFFPIYGGIDRAWRDGFLAEMADFEPEVGIAIPLHLTTLQSRWRFFETASGGVGMGPLNAKPGDLVCVLYGSAMPVVLRKQGTLYSHVGVCFILGLMKGEVADLVRNGEVVIQEVEIG